MPGKTERFPKSKRLQKRKDFLSVYRRGKRYTGELFVVCILQRETDQQGRLGVSVSRKVGKAVVRNRIKRVVREYFRRHPQMFSGTDVVIEVKPQAAQCLPTLSESLAKHLKMAYSAL